MRGLVPRWGGGGAWQNPRCQFAVPSHNSSFSYLGVPAPAGMSDCYESMSRTPIRDRPLRQPLIRHSRHPFVNSAPHSSFQRSKACPVPRYGAGIQKGWGGKDTIHMQESKRPEIFIHPFGLRKPICESNVTVESAWTSPQIT